MDLPASIGKYELLEFLGGGMADVFRARDTLIDSPVVVKVLKDTASNDPEAKARFLLEAKLARKVQHANIVTVYDYGEYEGRPFMVMEYLQGEDLRAAIRSDRTGPLMNRLRIARDIATALDFVHSNGITHRDIKPENIHIDTTGRVKLMDFGIAKTADMSFTRTGMAMGTPFYMSPEQVRGQPVTVQVDIYAWGLLLYELLTGTRSITADTMEAVFYQILNVPVDLAALENAAIPPAVRDLVVRCTAKEATERPQGFGAVIAELDANLAAGRGAPTQPLPVHRQPVPEPAPSPSRSGLLLWIAVGAVALSAIAAVAILLLPPKAPPAIPGMVYFPAGTFLAGSDKHPVKLGAFYIDETEVTNEQFADFCRATGCTPPAAAADLPVVDVTIGEARAFAKWKGKRLPTGQEWERAARGDKGAKFPWGDEADPFRANVADNSTLGEVHQLMKVKSFPAAFGVYDMIGNAWEMVEGPVTPMASTAERFKATPQDTWIAMRGGAFDTKPFGPELVWDQAPIPERVKNIDIGFRCAKDPAAK